MKAALAQVVPRVFSDAGETVGFAETGETFEAARLALAEAIEARWRRSRRNVSSARSRRVRQSPRERRRTPRRMA